MVKLLAGKRSEPIGRLNFLAGMQVWRRCAFEVLAGKE
jgi:hypothetical protein